MIYKRIFQEKALSVQDAIKSNYSLLISKEDDLIYFVLYDSSLIQFKKEESSIKSLDKAILAVLKIYEQDNFYLVYESAAKPGSGAGVLLYDIVLSYLSKINKGLAPDRTSVSKSAQHVWEYYFNNRKDVEKIPIDDVKNKDQYPVTKNKNDDGFTNQNIPDKDYKTRTFLNHIYKIKKPINYSKLVKNNNDFMLKNKKYTNLQKDLMKRSDELFISLYKA